MYRPNVSGLILAHGHRDIGPTLASIEPICDQVVVVNDASNPIREPTKVALDAYGGEVDVIDRVFDTFPEQRNAGLEKALGQWVLVIDSDETVSQPLRIELSNLDPDGGTDVFALPRREVIRGRELLKVSIGGPHPRLFRSHLRYAPEPVVHERLEGWGSYGVGALEGHILHHHTGSLIDLLRKEYRYGEAFGQFTGSQAHELSWRQLFRQSVGDFIHREGLSEGAVGAIVTLSGISAKIGEKRSRQNIQN